MMLRDVCFVLLRNAQKRCRRTKEESIRKDKMPYRPNPTQLTD